MELKVIYLPLMNIQELSLNPFNGIESNPHQHTAHHHNHHPGIHSMELKVIAPAIMNPKTAPARIHSMELKARRALVAGWKHCPSPLNPFNGIERRWNTTSRCCMARGRIHSMELKDVFDEVAGMVCPRCRIHSMELKVCWSSRRYLYRQDERIHSMELKVVSRAGRRG